MEVSFVGDPAYTAAYCALSLGEGIHTEQGRVAFMSAGIKVKASTPGGVVKSWVRSRFAEETFLMGNYTALVDGAWVAVAPPYPGDILVTDITNDGLIIESGCLLALQDGVNADVKPAGISNMLLREGITVLKLTGSGKALMSSYGSMERFELAPGQTIIVDTGYIVAWTPTCTLRVGPLGGVTTSVLTGEGLVGEFTGPGSVYLQTRSPQKIQDWLLPRRGQNSGSG